MRQNEFKLRQKEAASRPTLSPERKRQIKRYLEQGFNKKALTLIFGLTYQELKAIKRGV